MLRLKALQRPQRHQGAVRLRISVGFEISVERVRDGDDVFVQHAFFALRDAVGAGTVFGGREYVGEADFVLLCDEALGLVVFDVPDE